jgi:hypothetical protein
MLRKSGAIAGHSSYSLTNLSCVSFTGTCRMACKDQDSVSYSVHFMYELHIKCCHLSLNIFSKSLCLLHKVMSVCTGFMSCPISDIYNRFLKLRGFNKLGRKTVQNNTRGYCVLDFAHH